MKKFFGLLAAILMICCLWSGAVVADDAIDAYHLNAGDKIKIHVFGEPDMDVEIRLGASGNIRYPFLGKIHISGMTLAELEHKITRELRNGYFVDPQVRVSMEEFRPFYVNGEVAKPGAYPYQPRLNVRKAISLAGGFTEDADKSKVFLIHADDIRKRESKATLDQKMRPGDILTINQSFFFVNGEVGKPGKYPYQPGLTVRKAISLAGGFAEDADKSKLLLIHADDISKRESKATLDQKMQPGDIITVKRSFFFVNGEVGKPGKYSYQPDLTYRMAISMAGGLKERADEDKVFVIHEGQDKRAVQLDNLDTEVRPGDMITVKQSFF